MLLLLENIIQINYVPLPDVLVQINLDPQMFGKRNMWHSVFPNLFGKWVFNKHREDDWVFKHSNSCIVALPKMWIERCSMFHEITFSTIRIEDH